MKEQSKRRTRDSEPFWEEIGTVRVKLRCSEIKHEYKRWVAADLCRRAIQPIITLDISTAGANLTAIPLLIFLCYAYFKYPIVQSGLCCILLKLMGISVVITISAIETTSGLGSSHSLEPYARIAAGVFMAVYFLSGSTLFVLCIISEPWDEKWGFLMLYIVTACSWLFSLLLLIHIAAAIVGIPEFIIRAATGNLGPIYGCVEKAVFQRKEQPIRLGRGRVGETCLVCLSQFEPGEILAALDKRGHHVFHYECVLRALTGGPHCPACAHEIIQHPRHI